MLGAHNNPRLIRIFRTLNSFSGAIAMSRTLVRQVLLQFLVEHSEETEKKSKRKTNFVIFILFICEIEYMKIENSNKNEW